MEALGIIVAGVVIVVIAILPFLLKYHFRWRRHQKRYSSLQSGRPVLSADEFCRRAGLDSSVATIVSAIRAKLAESGNYDALRIYPEDSFSPQFGLDYDDDVAIVVQDMKIIEGFHSYSFPLEEVDSVGDFIKIILRLKREAEPSI